MVNKLDFLLGGSAGALIAVLGMSYLKSEAVFYRAPLPPVEVQNIDGQGNRGLVVDSKNRMHRNIFVNTNKTEGVFVPYEGVASDLANSYQARVEKRVREIMGNLRAEEAQMIHPMSHPKAYNRTFNPSKNP